MWELTRSWKSMGSWKEREIRMVRRNSKRGRKETWIAKQRKKWE
jgi:hypothetical protein